MHVVLDLVSVILPWEVRNVVGYQQTGCITCYWWPQGTTCSLMNTSVLKKAVHATLYCSGQIQIYKPTVTMVILQPGSAITSLTNNDFFLFPFIEVLLDPCRTWCPSSSCQAVCQLKEADAARPQLVRCGNCTLEFCSACKASWHPDQECQENPPITTFLPGESR